MPKPKLKRLFDIWVIIALLACFLANISVHHRPEIALLNSLIFFLSLVLYNLLSDHKYLLRFSWNKPSRFYLIFLGLIPLLRFQPKSYLPVFALLIGMFFLILPKKFPRGGRTFILIGLLILLLGNLFIANILTITGGLHVSINEERTIFINPSLSRVISQRRDEFALPYRLNFLIYNRFVYLPYLLGNLSNFFSLGNFYNTIFLANLFPFFLGLYYYLKDFNQQNKTLFWWAIVTLLTISIQRSADSFSSLYLAGPLILCLTLSGLKKLSSRLYLSLVLITLMLLLAKGV